ncbi:SDR family oxidoreductase [Lentibacillus sp. N15]|uniref:SDR family oxidoreductase n=1 Tax=Lentibacillus songyuanensis TaxID=3136161 RepID=UPI0031BBC9D3
MEKEVVVITGAGSGLGASLARKYSQQGYYICLLGRTISKLEEVALTLTGGSSIYKVNVTSLSRVQEVMEAIVNEHGGIDYLVNNAGVGVFKELNELQEVEIVAMIDINLKGTVFCTQAVLSHMQAQNRGQIINIVSASGKQAKSTESVYSASKFGVRGFSEAVAEELTETNIKVFCAYMGNMETDLWQKSLPQESLDEFMKPDDVADLIIKSTQTQSKLYVQEITILNHK